MGGLAGLAVDSASGRVTERVGHGAVALLGGEHTQVVPALGAGEIACQGGYTDACSITVRLACFDATGVTTLLTNPTLKGIHIRTHCWTEKKNKTTRAPWKQQCSMLPAVAWLFIKTMSCSTSTWVNWSEVKSYKRRHRETIAQFEVMVDCVVR